MIAIIGDVHGCYNTLKKLYEIIKNRYFGIDIYCVGDLVDRGRFSYETVDFVLQKGIKFTPGNHDFMFLHYVMFPGTSLAQSWLYNGYETTLDSYEGKSDDKMEEHLLAIKKSPLYLNLEDCFISHAGVSTFYESKIPANYKKNLDFIGLFVASDINNEHGLLWTRDKLWNLGKPQIVGHTRMKDVIYKKDSDSYYIDTSAFTGQKLTAVIMDRGEMLDKISIHTEKEDYFFEEED